MQPQNKGQGHSFCAFDRQFSMPHLKPRTKFEVSSSSSFEILRSKRIGVTSLTFQGHVTSSVT